MPSCRLLFVSILDEMVASYRFRVFKLLPFLQSAGIKAGVLHFNSRLETLAAFRLLADIVRHRKLPRVVVFQKTIAFNLARLARSTGAKLLLDWDDGSMQRIDGTWYPKTIERENERWVRLMDAAVVSCEEIRRWIQQWSKKTYVIPTCLDVENYEFIPGISKQKCVIGWVGSSLSRIFLKPIEQALRSIVVHHNCEIIVIGGDDPCLAPEIGAKYIPWQLALEPNAFSKLDIGINPLPNNERARMKAGFKLLQYMAAGLPVIASPVGANCDIVQHGWNGFLADTAEDWKIYLRQLVSNPDLRYWMGQNGKKFVNERYGLDVAAHLWQVVLHEII